MSRIHSNNFSTTLNGAINSSTTSVIITSATGFPSIGGGVTCNITVQENTTVEIMTVTARSGTTLTVTRGAEGTTPSAFSDASTVEIRFTRDSVDTKQDDLDGLSLTAVTVATGDKILIQDISDSDNLKTATAQSIADLYVQTAPAESDVTFTDITTNNASTTKHGYLKKLSNSATEYMDGTGNWSTPAGGGGGSSGITLLAVETASNSASLPFTTEITSTYTNYMFLIENMSFTSTSGSLRMQISFDGGSTWKTANSYNQCGTTMNSNSSSVGGFNAANGSAFLIGASSTPNAANSSTLHGEVYIHSPAGAYFAADWRIVLHGSGGGYANFITGGGTFNDGIATPPVTAVRFIASTGNINAGTVSLYGYQKV